MKSGSVLLLVLIAAILGVIVALRLREASAPAAPIPAPSAPDPDAVAKAELESVVEFEKADVHRVRRDETLKRYAIYIDRHPDGPWAKRAVELRDQFLADAAPAVTASPTPKIGTPAGDQELEDLYLQCEIPFRQSMAKRNYAGAASMVRDFMFRAWPDRQRKTVRVTGVDYAAIEAACGREGEQPWSWSKVSELASAAAGDPATPQETSLAQRLLLDLRNAAELARYRDQVEAGLAKIVARREALSLATFPGETARLSTSGDKITFDLGGGKTTTLDPWADLRDIDHVQLAARSLDEDPGVAKEKSIRDPALLLRSALYLYYSASGDTYQGPARELFARAVEAGATGAKLYSSNLLVDTKRAREEELKRMYERVVALLASDQWIEAKPLLDDLLAATDSPLVQRCQGELAAMAERIRAQTRKGEALAGQYHGHVDLLPGERLRVTYDFESTSQLEAFEVLTAVKGRWSLDRGALGSSGDRCAVRWRTPVAGDVDASWDLEPVDPPQNLALDLYWHPGADRHYSAVVGLDLAFGKQDPKDELEERFGMPRCCLLKHPLGVSLADRDWSTAEAWKPVIDRLIGSGRGAPRPRKDQSVRVRVAREGKRLLLAIDGRTAWEGEDGEYGEGFLLFYADSRARIDNLSVVFKP